MNRGALIVAGIALCLGLAFPNLALPVAGIGIIIGVWKS